MASTTSGDFLPSGGRIFTSIPDVFFIPEFVIGGSVWIQLASAGALGWVMLGSVFCFVVTTLWFFVFLCGANQGSAWPCLDVWYHLLAMLFYLGVSGLQVFSIILVSIFFKFHQLDIFTVMCFVATLLYMLHFIFSTIRWKRSKRTKRSTNQEEEEEAAACRPADADTQ